MSLSLSSQTQRTLLAVLSIFPRLSVRRRAERLYYLCNLIVHHLLPRQAPALSYPIMVDLTNTRRIFKLLLKPMPVGDVELTHKPYDLSSFEITHSRQDRPSDDYLEDAQLGL
ncbi:hypothetical protein EDD22DRAFT_484399 [Suillus occidentalis]|nr:hypothetical protein EDD22DRAFT_484399 [Suillus occidentalis]